MVTKTVIVEHDAYKVEYDEYAQGELLLGTIPPTGGTIIRSNSM